jgi:cGMP-dependent protein kinase
MKINAYKAGSVIIKKGNDGSLPANQKIIVVIEGSIKKSKNINLAAVRTQVYGEEFLL